MEITEELTRAFENHKVAITLRKDNPELWETVSMQAKYLPVSYASSSMDYQFIYFSQFGTEWNDISVVLHWGEEYAGIWPLAFNRDENGNAQLTSYGMEIVSPLFVEGLAERSQKRIIKSCIEVIEKLCEELKVKQWTSSEFFIDKLGISAWQQNIMINGAERTVRDELYLNLEGSMDEIRHNFGKSVKLQINAGLKLWDSNTLIEPDESVWEEFRLLHQHVAGRVTRSLQTWHQQLVNISKGKAFLVYIRDKEGIMVGGGYFEVSRDEGVYAVAAYNRELFDKPLGHVVQQLAVEEMKKRDIKWYKLGARPYTSEEPKPTQKEINIASNKQGFASHTFPKFIMKMKQKLT